MKSARSARTARRKLTIEIDEDVGRWVRVEAARKGASVAPFVIGLLRRCMLEERRYREALEQHFAQKPSRLRESGRLPARSEMHER